MKRHCLLGMADGNFHGVMIWVENLADELEYGDSWVVQVSFAVVDHLCSGLVSMADVYETFLSRIVISELRSPGH